MARRKRLIPENPYLPTQGLNADARGLAMNSAQCADIKNYRIFDNKITTRGGLKRLAATSPSGDPIIHQHTYKAPDGDITLFGFSKREAYKFSGTRWTAAMNNTQIDDCESATNWSSDLGSPSVSTSTFFEGTKSIRIFGAGIFNMNDTDIILAKDWGAGSKWDASSYTYLKFWVTGNGAQANVKVKYYSDSFVTLIEEFAISLGGSNTEWTEVVMAMTVPANYSAVQSFEIIADGNQTLGGGGLWVDDIRATLRLSNDMEFWHTTNFLDTTEGWTVVAAASNPPKPNAQEGDGAKRELWYYDTTNGYFDTLTQEKKVVTTEEDTNISITDDTGLLLTGNCDNITGSDTLLAGSFSMVVKGFGTIATSNAELSGGKYALLPVDNTKVQAGDAESYVQTDGTWSIRLIAGHGFSVNDIYVTYTEQTALAYKPRFVWNFHNRLLMGNIYDGANYNPTRIRASENADMTLVDDLDYWDLVDNDVTPITGGDAQGNGLTILKADSIVKATYLEGSSLIFSFDTVWKNGAWAGKTLKTYRGYQYFLGDDDVYQWDGSQRISITRQRRTLTIEERETGGYRVREKIFGAINWDQINNCFAFVYPRFNEYILGIVRAGQTYPTDFYVYNIARDIWYFFEFNPLTCAGNYYTDSAPTWGDLQGSWGEQGWNWGEGTLEGVDAAVTLAEATGDVFLVDETYAKDGGYEDAEGTWVSGSDISTMLITRDFIARDLARQDRFTKLNFEAKGGDITVGISGQYVTDSGAFQQTTDITMDQIFKERRYFPDKMAEHVRFAFTSDDSNTIRWIQPSAITQETTND